MIEKEVQEEVLSVVVSDKQIDNLGQQNQNKKEKEKKVITEADLQRHYE